MESAKGAEGAFTQGVVYLHVYVLHLRVIITSLVNYNDDDDLVVFCSKQTPYFYSDYYLMTLLMIVMKDLLKLFKELSVLPIN